MKSIRNKELSPRTTAISLIVFVIVCVLIGYLVVKAKSNNPSAPVESADETAAPIVKTEKKAEVKAEEADKKASDPYDIVAERDMFKPIASSSGSRVGRSGPLAPMSVNGLPGDMAANFGRSSRSDSSRLAYTGYVDTPDGPMALIENTSSKETKIVWIGDSAFGMEVWDITPSKLYMQSGFRSVELAMGENKTASAPAAPAAPAAKPGGDAAAAAAASSSPGQAAAAQPTAGQPPSGRFGGRRGGSDQSGNGGVTTTIVYGN